MDERFDKSLQNQSGTIIKSQVPHKRPKLIADLLIHMNKGAIDQNPATEVLKRIQSRMDRISPEILVGSETRSNLRKNAPMPHNPHQNFNAQDVKAIATNFEISARDAHKITQLYQNCFDSKGNFIRTAFEKNVPEFARHEKKVFEILWEFLKETPQRSNRLPFLNSLQIMVAEIRTPMRAIKVLLTDFTQRPEGVQYPDRNAMMLINQLLRAYNKEAIMNIEMTPEEVLLVKSGLDKKVVNYVAWKVDGQSKPFQQKTATIRKRIAEAMDPDLSEKSLWPIRFLLALEREVYIFLALVGGKTALEAMRNALNDYGNPVSLHPPKESPDQMKLLLSHLAAMIRAIGRLGCQSDLALLNEIKIRQDQFMDLHPDRGYQIMVRHVMNLVDASKAAICARNS